MTIKKSFIIQIKKVFKKSFSTAEARVLYGGQGGSFLYGGGSWQPGIPYLVRFDVLKKYTKRTWIVELKILCLLNLAVLYKS